MAGWPLPPTLFPNAGEAFPPLPLSSRAALAPTAGAPPGFPRTTTLVSPITGASPDIPTPPANPLLTAAPPPGLAAPPTPYLPTDGVSSGPTAPPVALPNTAGALPRAPFSVPPSLLRAARRRLSFHPRGPFLQSCTPHRCSPCAIGARLRPHRCVAPTVEPPPPMPIQSTTLVATSGLDGSRSALAFSLPEAALLAPGFPHIPLDMIGGTPMRGCPLSTTIYSQSSAITSSLHAPSDDAAALLAATRAAVTAARQRAQDAARTLEQEQTVVDAIERQYAETYRHLAGKGMSDGSPTSAHHNADTFEPAPASASTLHAQAAALTSIRATVTDVLAPDSTQYPQWRD
eukprot:XP_008646683.1 proline-rich receptor-like protein kinase PERK14 [Zea mays]